MTQFEGRKGRPYEYVDFGVAPSNVTFPDETGGLFISEATGVLVNLGTANGATSVFLAELGFIEGDFRTLAATTPGVRVHAVLISR